MFFQGKERGLWARRLMAMVLILLGVLTLRRGISPADQAYVGTGQATVLGWLFIVIGVIHAVTVELRNVQRKP